MDNQLELREVLTPSTRNCLAMAIVQSMCDSDLEGQDELLTAATGSLKRGVNYAGQLHLSEQLAHGTRFATLTGVQRVWLGMEVSLSKKQFRWYLEE